MFFTSVGTKPQALDRYWGSVPTWKETRISLEAGRTMNPPAPHPILRPLKAICRVLMKDSGSRAPSVKHLACALQPAIAPSAFQLQPRARRQDSLALLQGVFALEL